MIQTKNVKVDLKKGRDLQRVTTKDIEPSPRIVKPVLDLTKKSPLVTTRDIGDIADIEEKRARDEVVAQRKELKKGDPAYVDDKGKLVSDEPIKEMLEEFAQQDVVSIDGVVIAESFKPKSLEDKPWKDMTPEERKEIMMQEQAEVEPTKKPYNKMNAAERKEYQEFKKEEMREGK